MGDWRVALPRSGQHSAGMHSTKIREKEFPSPKHSGLNLLLPCFLSTDHLFHATPNGTSYKTVPRQPHSPRNALQATKSKSQGKAGLSGAHQSRAITLCLLLNRRDTPGHHQLNHCSYRPAKTLNQL